MPRKSASQLRRSASDRARSAPHARKALGQHFLTDETALSKIVAAAELVPGETVVEVGAGTGELTAVLGATGRQVVAVELDESLCRVLHGRFAGQDNIRVLNANVLDYPPAELLREAAAAPPYVVVANIPYYITAPILRHFLEAESQPRRLILTVQREVAETLSAGPGALSLLAASVQFYAHVSTLFRLDRAAFRPPPKVDSAVVRIDVQPEPRVLVADQRAFFDLIRAGFRAPRKQLHNALSQGVWLPPGEANSLLTAAAIDPMRRAQTLSLEEWAALTDAYLARRSVWATRGDALEESSGADSRDG
jgi:16S rRNA (adenine1518-N6/adenine1519-N6)-dimethyltransferase